MLYKRNDTPETGWNLIIAAPWADRLGRAQAIRVVTRVLSDELSSENKLIISRVTVLPTKDQFVREITAHYGAVNPEVARWVTNVSAAGIPIAVGYILCSRAN